MFYKIIENKRNQWLSSPNCTITSLIDYIVKTGQMRDAQIDAIKTYLFLQYNQSEKLSYNWEKITTDCVYFL